MPRLRLLLLLACLPWVARAADYTAGDGSRLAFRASAMGEAFEGRFEAFRADIRFDPADLAASRFDVVIRLASARTDNDERDALLHGEAFFDAGGGATARYRAEAFEALGDGRFLARGTLSLRGQVHEVPLRFTWTPGAVPVLEGEARVDRLAFGIGRGDWADPGTIPAAVRVTTVLRLQPAPPAP